MSLEKSILMELGNKLMNIELANWVTTKINI